MATKTINLTEEAYTRLRNLKRRGESFSDVVNRITGKHHLADIVGVLSDEEAEVMRDHVEESRERTRERLDRLFERMS